MNSPAETPSTPVPSTQTPTRPAPLRVAAPALQNFIAALFERAGMSAPHAATVAQALVWANLRGVDTHGVARVARYLEFIATGIVSLGRLMQAKRLKETLAPGLALDAQGHPTTDGQAASIPLPLGGAKGSGLSLMIEMLTSLATGNPLIAEFFSGKPEGKRHQQNALILAIDAFRFCPEVMFRADVARTIAALKALPPDPAAGGILMPGERGNTEMVRRRRDGIALPGAVVNDLAAAASKAGLTSPWAV